MEPNPLNYKYVTPIYSLPPCQLKSSYMHAKEPQQDTMNIRVTLKINDQEFH